MIDDAIRLVLAGAALPWIKESWSRIAEEVPPPGLDENVFFEYLPALDVTYCEIRGDLARSRPVQNWLRDAGTRTHAVVGGGGKDDRLAGHEVVEVFPTDQEAWPVQACLTPGHVLERLKGVIDSLDLGAGSIEQRAVYAEYLHPLQMTFLHLGGRYWLDRSDLIRSAFGQAPLCCIGRGDTSFEHQLSATDVGA